MRAMGKENGSEGITKGKGGKAFTLGDEFGPNVKTGRKQALQMGEAGSRDDNFQSKQFRAATRSQRNGLSEIHWFPFKDVFI